MTAEQIQSLAVILGALLLFAWGRFRHDLVALIALLAAVHMGLVPGDQAFAGFGHPAVITVAAVLVLSYALSASGVIDILARHCVPQKASIPVQVAGLGGLGALLSSVMNNVGALALLMPVAIAAAKRSERSPSLLLMPLAFATMLGGCLTLIATPSNLVVSDYRRLALGEPFALLDFAPVGLAVVAAGLVFVALVGWRLIPARKSPAAAELFGIANYVTEASVPPKSKSVGLSFREIEAKLEEPESRLFGLVRGSRRIPSTAWWERVQEGDVLVFQAPPTAFSKVREALQLTLIEEPESATEALGGEGRTLVEAVVQPRALIEGLTAEEMRLRSRYGIALVAISRQGNVASARLKCFRFAVGDVLLLEGAPGQIAAASAALGLLPLAQRELPAGGRRALPAVGFFALAILAMGIGLAPPAVALSTAVALVLATRCITLREAYEAVDWPVLVLLGAMLPVGGTLESTGATEVIAGWLLSLGHEMAPVFVLTAVLVVTMFISDVINNAATAVMMAPLSLGLARGLGVSPDPFLMAVAIGAALAFLTPIGHQNNTLVMGPGGYRFGDYWRMGLPLEIVLVVVSVPLLLLVWPL